MPGVIHRTDDLAVPGLLPRRADEGMRVHVELRKRGTFPPGELQLKVEVTDIPAIPTLQRTGLSRLHIHPDAHVGRVGEQLAVTSHQPVDMP
jgi:hypothetical protein